MRFVWGSAQKQQFACLTPILAKIRKRGILREKGGAEMAKGGEKPIFHIECGEVDRIEIRIYTISADLVHKAEITGLPNNGASYEYTWDINRIASGVYLYLVRVHKDGKIVKKLKKLAIIK